MKSADVAEALSEWVERRTGAIDTLVAMDFDETTALLTQAAALIRSQGAEVGRLNGELAMLGDYAKMRDRDVQDAEDDNAKLHGLLRSWVACMREPRPHDADAIARTLVADTDRALDDAGGGGA